MLDTLPVIIQSRENKKSRRVGRVTKAKSKT